MRNNARILTFAMAFVLIATLTGCGGGTGARTTPVPAPAPKPGSSGKMAAGSARLSDADSGRTVELAVGGTLVIDLEENPSTGFTWNVREPIPAALKKKSDTYVSPEDQGLVGAAGRRILTYDVVAAGRGEITITYARSWESVAPAKTFTVTVVAK